MTMDLALLRTIEQFPSSQHSRSIPSADFLLAVNLPLTCIRGAIQISMRSSTSQQSDKLLVRGPKPSSAARTTPAKNEGAHSGISVGLSLSWDSSVIWVALLFTQKGTPNPRIPSNERLETSIPKFRVPAWSPPSNTSCRKQIGFESSVGSRREPPNAYAAQSNLNHQALETASTGTGR